MCNTIPINSAAKVHKSRALYTVWMGCMVFMKEYFTRFGRTSLKTIVSSHKFDRIYMYVTVRHLQYRRKVSFG